jgi:ubiquinone biosynthesis protein
VPLTLSLRGTLSEIRRIRRIAEVLIRNGLGLLAESLGLGRFVPPWRKRGLQAEAGAQALSMPQRVRRTLEQLGPTYIKLGQILSTRPDLLSADYITELTKLLDASPPAPTDAIIAIIERELGGPLDSLFASFERESIASASIGQVHRAALHDGTEVVVKVQRPGVEETMLADLNILRTQVRFLEGRSETLRRYGVRELVDEFTQSLRDELDYTIEGRNADKLGSTLAAEDVLIPRVIWERSSKRVITLTALDGIKLAELDRLRARGYDLASIADRIARLYLTSVFVHGVFHADPHPANILICGDNIGLVDFGVVGYLAPRMKDDLGDLLFALVQQSADDMVHVIMRMGAVGAECDRRGLRREVGHLLVRYYGASLESVSMASFLVEIMGLAFRYHVRLPADLVLMARTVITVEGVARKLDPALVLTRYLEPFVRDLVKERLSLHRAMAETVSTLRELEALVHVLPRRVDALTEQLEQGELTLGVDVRRTDQGLRKLDAIANRLAFSVIVAAILLGSALMVTAGPNAASFKLPFTQISIPIAQIGFVVSGLLGAWLLLSIIRSKGL